MNSKINSLRFFSKNYFLKIQKEVTNKKEKESDKIGNLKYSTWYINFFSLIISIILYSILIQFIDKIDLQYQKIVLKAGFTVNDKSENKIPNNVETINSNLKTETKEEQDDWHIEIPIINLNAKIEEGTTKEIMDYYIGHFEESKKWVGNVCLAAHNRGYENNYFAEIKTLKENDRIIYYYNDASREYLVKKHEIIKDTDLTCLENTEENTITLITCVENEPNYRRCIQAIENK